MCLKMSTIENGHYHRTAVLVRAGTPDAHFAAKLDALGDAITNLALPETRIYGPNATDEHKDDMAFVALFQKG